MNARFTSQSDFRGYGSNVCFVPKADSCAAAKNGMLFDHLVGALLEL
jgi:hypothetical protein